MSWTECRDAGAQQGFRRDTEKIRSADCKAREAVVQFCCRDLFAKGLVCEDYQAGCALNNLETNIVLCKLNENSNER